MSTTHDEIADGSVRRREPPALVVVPVVDENSGPRPGMGVMFYDLDEPTKRALELSSASTLIMLPATMAATPCWVRCATETALAVMPQN